jgi:hypothetical protein
VINSPNSMNLYIHLGIHENPYAGMFQYGRALIDGLREIAPTIKVAGAIVTSDERITDELHDANLQTLYIKKPKIWRQLYAFCEPFLSVPRERADIIHGVSNFVPLRARGKKVVTIHDLIQAYPVETPRDLWRRGYVGLRSALYRTTFAASGRTVDRILTIHQTQKKLIEETLSPRCPVEVAYTPIPKEFLVALPKDIKRKPRSVVLLASRDLRKNIQKGAKVLAACGQDLSSVTVVLANKGLLGWARSLQWPKGISVDFVCEPTHNDLARIFLATELLLFPSIAEGLGLPIFQAIMTGTKVVCFEEFLVPEIAPFVGTGIVSCDPHSEESLGAAVKKAFLTSVTGQEFSSYAELVRKHFSAKALATKVHKIYGELL